MTKVLVIQGAGMNMRGKAQLESFGPATLDQINDEIRAYAKNLDVEVEFFHSNIMGEVLNALYDAHDSDIDAAIINPAGYTASAGPLPNAIGQVRFPVIEVHASNPVARGLISTVQPAVKGLVHGFGVYGYYLALQAAKQLTSNS